MYCSKCGNELGTADRFCTKCGNKVEYNIENNNESEEIREESKDELAVAVERLKNGDENGFSEIYSHTYRYVYTRSRYILGDEQEALDLTQEVYLALYRGINSLKKNESIFGWLKTVTFRQGIRFIEKRNRTVGLQSETSEEIFDILPDERVEIENEYMDRQDVDIIRSCVEQLSEEQRLVILAYYYDEMKIEEIAELMGVSEGTVKSRLYLARKKLRKIIPEQEEKQGYKLHAFGIPALAFTLNDMMKSEVSVPDAVINEVFQQICRDLEIRIGNTVQQVVDNVGQDKMSDLKDLNSMKESYNVIQGKSPAAEATEKFTGISAKKIAIVVAGVLVAGGIAGAIIMNLNGNDKDTKGLEYNEGQVEEVFDENKFLDEISVNIHTLNSCKVQDFCVEVDDSNEYFPLFNSEEEANSENRTVAKLVNMPTEWETEELESKWPGYYIEPLPCSYKPVTNFDSVKEVKQAIEELISVEVLNYIFDGYYEKCLYDRLTEYEGILYQVSGACGYGEVYYDEDSVDYIGNNNESYYVSIDVYLMEQYNYTEQLEFKKVDGKWIITNIQNITEPVYFR